jgi:hypothetical protein
MPATAEAAVAAPAFEPGPEDVPLLDLELLQGLARNVPAPALRGLLDRGLAGADESCRRLKAALGDPDRLVQEPHRLCGTAGSFGLARVSALVGVLEERPGDAPDLAALVAEIEKAVQATQRAVQELRLNPDST